MKDLFMTRNTHLGVISANFVLPMAFRIENDNIGAKEDFAVSLTEPILVDGERKNLLETIIALGGQSEQIYEETDSLKIARVFRKAGPSDKLLI